MCRLPVALIAVVSTIALTQIASAADLPRKAPALVPAPPPAISWTGFYVGLNAGYGWGSNHGIDNTTTSSFCNNPPISSCPAESDSLVAALRGQFGTDPRGFIGGGQIGYNWQRGTFVWGVETDFQGTAIKGGTNVINTVECCSSTGAPGHPVIVTGAGGQKLDWFGTLRGRLGWLPINPLLVYVTGGLAYGHVRTNTSFSGVLVNPTPINGSTALSASDTRAGWTVGGGLEWMFAPRWSVKGEYLYYDLGTVTLNQNFVLAGGGFPSLFGAGVQSEAHYKGSIARAGINYRF